MPPLKWTDELIEKWRKMLETGMIDKDGIMARYGVKRNELNLLLRGKR